MPQQQLYRYTVDYNGYRFTVDGYREPTEDDIHKIYVDSIVRNQSSNTNIPGLDIGTLETDEDRANINANTNISFDSDKEYRDATWWGRFAESAKLAAIPHFGKMQSELSPADESSEIWAEAFGGLTGAVGGMLPISFLTGGVGAIGAGANVASKFNTINKLVKQANQLKKLGKTAEAAKKTKKATSYAKKYEDVFKHAIKKNEYYNPSGLLGQLTPYRQGILKLAEKNPNHARALNLFANNLGTFSIYGQTKLPYDRLEGRLNQLGADAVSSVVFSVAGLPTMLGYASKGVKYGVEPGMLLGAGMYSDLGQSDMTLEERTIHGMALVGFHYARQLSSALNVKSKIATALRLTNPELSDARLNSIMDNPGTNRLVKSVMDEAIKKPTYADRKKPERNVELLRTYEKEDGKHAVRYRDMSTGQGYEMSGSSKAAVMNAFTKKFSKNVPQVPEKIKSRNLTPEEKIDLKNSQSKERELRDAIKSNRKIEVVEDTKSSLEDVKNPFKETKGMDDVEIWTNKVQDAESRIKDANLKYEEQLARGINPGYAENVYNKEVRLAKTQLEISKNKLNQAYKGVAVSETAMYDIPVGGVKRFQPGDFVKIPKWDVNNNKLDYTKAGIGKYLGTLDSFSKESKQEIIMPEWMQKEPTRYTNFFRDISVFEIKTHGGSRTSKVAIAGKLPQKVFDAIKTSRESDKPILEYVESSKEGKPLVDNPIVRQERRVVQEDLGGGFTAPGYKEVSTWNASSPIFGELFTKKLPSGGMKPENIRTVEAESIGFRKPVGNIKKALKLTGIKDDIKEKHDFIKGKGQFSIGEVKKWGETAERNLTNLVTSVGSFHRSWAENRMGEFGAQTKKPWNTADFKLIYDRAVELGYKKSPQTLHKEFGPGGKISNMVRMRPEKIMRTDTFYQYSPTRLKKIKLSDGKKAFPDGVATPELARRYELDKMESLGRKLEKRRDEERAKFEQFQDADINQWPDMNLLDRKATIDKEVYESYPEFNPVNDAPWTVLAKWDSRQVNEIKTKTRRLLKGGEVARFKTKEEAESFGNEAWMNPESIESQIINTVDQITNIKGPEVQKFQYQQKQLKIAQKEANIPQEEYSYILKELYPESLGSSNNMTPEQIQFATAFISPSGNTKVYQDKMSSIVPPVDMISKTQSRWQKLKFAAADLLLPTSTYHMMSLSKTAGKRGRDMITHERMRQEITGEFSEFQSNIRKAFGIGQKDFKKMSSVIDKKFEEFFDPSLEKYNIEQFTEQFNLFQKKILAEILIPSGVNVRIADKANAPFEQLFESYDRFGNPIELANGYDALRVKGDIKYFDSQGNTKQPLVTAERDVMRNGEWVKVPTDKVVPKEYYESLRTFNKDTGKFDGGWYIQGKDRYIVEWSDKNTYKIKKIGADRVEALNPASEASRYVKIHNRDGTPGKFNHHIETNFLSRILTDDFRNLMSTNAAFRDGVAWEVARTDPSFRKMAGTVVEKHEAAKKHLNNSNKLWEDKAGVYGTQYARVANLPPMMAWEKGTNRFIELTSMKDVNGKIISKGSKVIDRNGNSKEVGKTIDVYERNLDKIMSRYGQKVAHVAPTTMLFGERGAMSERQSAIYEKIRKETDEPFANWSQESLELQLNAVQKNHWYDGPIRNLTIATAQLGLSSPFSGYKNFILGQQSNATVYGFREALNGLSRSLLSPRETSQLTGRLGGKEAGVHELMTGRVAYSKYNPGMMRATEIINRMTSVAIAEPALKRAIDNLNDSKNIMNKGVSKDTSMRLLSDVFKFTDKQISEMVRMGSQRLHERPDYIKQAQQMSHIITQGGPSLPFVPKWMGRNWAKPLTLFYRVAYRMTENVANSVIKPLVVDGNPVPMVRYLSLLPLSGAAIFSAHYYALGEDMRNRFKGDADKYFELALKAEGLAVFSNAFNEHGDALESYSPAVWNTTKTIATNLWAGLTGKKTVPQSLKDMSTNGVVLFNRLNKVYERQAQPLLTARKDSRRRQRQFTKVFFRDKPYLGGELDNLTTKSPHYRMVKNVFWTDNAEEKSKIYYAARNYVAQNELNKNPSLIKNLFKADKMARTNLKTIISAQRPIPTSWRKKGTGTKTRFELYMSKLDPKTRQDEIYIDNEYKKKLREWNAAISKYRTKYSKDPWMSPNPNASRPPSRSQVQR